MGPLGLFESLVNPLPWGGGSKDQKEDTYAYN